MKRLLLCGVIAAFGVGFVAGCGEETKTKTDKSATTSGGKAAGTPEKKDDKSGEKTTPAEP